MIKNVARAFLLISAVALPAIPAQAVPRVLTGGIVQISPPLRVGIQAADVDFYVGQTLNPNVGVYGPFYTGEPYPELYLSRSEWPGYYTFGTR